MLQAHTLSVGMEGPTEAIAVASVAQEQGADVIALGTLGTRPGAIDPLIRPLQSQSTPRVCVDDAGPCGAGLSRSLTQTGAVGWVVAPSVRPTKAGDRVTTDRRDARPLARRMRSGDLTPVAVPAVHEAAIRDLRRAREATLRDLQAAQVRLTAFWRRQDSRSTGQAPWSPAPRRWRSAGGCPTPAPPMVWQEAVQTVTAPTARWPRREHARHAQVHPWRCAPVVEALQALRGVQCPVAVPPVAALGDLTRCETPRHLRHDLGRTPAESSRGARHHQGRMTPTGTTHARRALVAGAWASR